jgi:Effector-associated domain 10/Leucine Rich repeats (2 copies)
MNDELIAILDRIAKKEQTDADIQILRDWLSSGKKLVSQSGKYSINVEEGKDIYIGGRIYSEPDAEAIRKIVRDLLDELPRDPVKQISKQLHNFNSLKIVFAILFLSLSSIVVYNFLPAEKSAFVDSCKNRQLNPEQKPLIEILLEGTGTKDCKLASKSLLKLQELNLSNASAGSGIVKKYLENNHMLSSGLPNDIQVLSSLTQLKELDLSGHWRVKDISPLRSLKHLQKLDLEGCGLSDVSDLLIFSNLKTLNLENNFGISDITPLTSLKNLTELNLSRTSVKNIQSLSSLKNLTKLDLRNTKVTTKICPVPETQDKPVCIF